MTGTYSPVGADFSAQHDTAQFKLGTRAFGEDGTEWIYVVANGAITQYDVVGIDENFSAATASSTVAGGAHMPGLAQRAFTTAYYGWVAIRGSNIYVRAYACSKDSQLYVGSTGVSAGIVVSTPATGTVALNGIVTVTSAASAANVEVIATNPFFTA